MSTVNKVVLIGNLGDNPVNKFDNDGNIFVSRFSLATSYKDKTEWHKVVAFGSIAEVCSKYLKKGSRVYIEGRLETRKWNDNAGVDRYTTEIIVSDMKMLGDNIA